MLGGNCTWVGRRYQKGKQVEEVTTGSCEAPIGVTMDAKLSGGRIGVDIYHFES